MPDIKRVDLPPVSPPEPARPAAPRETPEAGKSFQEILSAKLAARAAPPPAARPAPPSGLLAPERLREIARFVEQERPVQVEEVKLLRAYSPLERDEALYEVSAAGGMRYLVIRSRDGSHTLFTRPG